MTMNYVSNDLIEQAELRNKLIDRVDVLNKVKELFLIPKFNMMTTKMVAEYYGVSVESVKNVYKRNKDELDSDGMQCILSSELSEGHFDPLKIDHRIMKGTVRGSTAFDIDGYFLEIRNGYNMFFTPRAVLRIGMLLRDSEVAKEVRTQLLNTFEQTTVEQRISDITEEEHLALRILRAENSCEVTLATKNLMDFYNRRNAVLVAQNEALESKNADLQESNSNLQQTNTTLMGENIGLKAENTNLNTELDVAFNRFSTWEAPEIVRKLITAMGATSKEYASAWNQLYSNLRYHHGICLKNRKRKPNETAFSTVKPDEWNQVLSECWVMARRRGIDIAKLLGKENAAIMEQYASLAPEII